MLSCKKERFFIIVGLLALGLFVFCFDSVAAKLLTSPSTKSFRLCGGQVDIAASEWEGDTGIFTGSLFIQSASKKPEAITVRILKDNSLFYSKTVVVNPGKTLNFSVLSPIICKAWYDCRVLLGDSYGDTVQWASFDRHYMDPTDIPLVQPRKTSSLGNSYLDYLSISTLRLDRGQWDKLPEIKKEAILDWVTMGGFFEQTESPGESNGLLKKYPPMNFSNRKYNQYGRGKLIEKKLFSNDYGSGSIVANRGEFSPSPSWEVRLISPGLFIPAVVIFALIIGPGAIFYSRRKKNPALVLALIPIISLISCVIILILSILNDGISPKVCRQMITYLDQTRGKALTQQITGVEAPLGLNSPVEFPEDSIVVLSAKLSSSSGGYCVVENGTIKLNSFVQARIPAFFGMSRLEKRRERLEIKEENESVKVMNGLGCGIEKLLLRDSKGNYWHKEEMIPPGKEAALNRCYDGAGKKQYAGFQLSNLLSSELKHSGYLGYGCYQARLTKNVFGVEGVKSNREVGDNFSILIGRYIKVNN